VGGRVPSGAETSGVADLYLSPSDETRDGRSAATAIPTLSRAHELISQAKPDYDITVHIASGTYTVTLTTGGKTTTQQVKVGN